jgi:hypothetical protein
MTRRISAMRSAISGEMPDHRPLEIPGRARDPRFTGAPRAERRWTTIEGKHRRPCREEVRSIAVRLCAEYWRAKPGARR